MTRGTGTIKEDTLISPLIDVSAWKSQRTKLINSIFLDSDELSAWKSAFELLNTRITTRFLNPIKWILEKGDNVGEGFSVVALQCILIEFLEAFYQGKIYTTSENPRDFEYSSSKNLFCDFLTKHKPFSNHFRTPANARGFYDNVRCGLLHEAATKQTSCINTATDNEVIVLFEENDPKNMRIYRENFNRAILIYIESYKNELLSSNKLKTNFIRKIDDICGIKHAYYFAYGSNMCSTRLLERIKKYHLAFPAVLKDHKFVYNKKSTDGTAKANIEKSLGDFVCGVCFEIDYEDFKILKDHEGGYNQIHISIVDNKDKKVEAVTYISESIDKIWLPSLEYKNLILKAADYWNLDKCYVSMYLS